MSAPLTVKYSEGNGQWVILGGGLPRGSCWAAFDTKEEAEAEAREISDDIGVPFLE